MTAVARWFSRVGVGLAITHDRVAAVALRGREVVWQGEVHVESNDGLEGAIGTLLDSTRSEISWPIVDRLRPAGIHVVVGPHAAQTKRLTELPAVTDNHLLASMIATNVSRFFVCREPGVVTGVERLTNGSVRATRIERRVVDAVIRASQRHRSRVRSILPSAALPEADGTLGLSAAQNAAMQRGEHPLAFRPTSRALRSSAMRDEGASSERIPRWRAFAAVLALVVTLAATAVSPVLAAKRAELLARRRFNAIASAYDRANANERELGRVSTMLNETSAFEQGRTRVALVIGDLARTLPQDAAIANLRFDSSFVTLLAVAPKVAGLLALLDGLPSVTSPEIAGPVTRELLAGRELERATIRFRLTTGRREKPTTLSTSQR